MNVVLHQVRTDLVRLRWWLLAWSGMLAAATLIPALKLDLLVSDADAAGRLLTARAWLSNITTLFGWVLAVRVVHGDPVDGSTAFWLTRPVSPRQLFAAKAGLVIGLVALVPAAASTLVGPANGVEGLTLLRVFVESAVTNLVFGTAILLLASTTRDAARLVIAGIVLTGAWLYLRVVLQFAALSTVEALEAQLTRYSALLVGIVVLVAGSLATIACHYATRRTRRSLVTALVLVAISVATAALWPWNFLALRRSVDERVFNPRPVDLALSSIEARTRTTREGRSVWYRAQLRETGVPPGWAVVPHEVDAQLRVGGAPTLRFSGRAWSANAFDSIAWLALGEQGFQAIAGVVGGRWLNDQWSVDSAGGRRAVRTERGVPLAVLESPESFAAKHTERTGDYSAILTCGALRVKLAGVLPLRHGAEGRVEGLETTVLDFRRERLSRGVMLFVGVRAARPVLFYPHVVPSVAFVLRNRARSELAIGVLGNTTDPWDGLDGPGVHVWRGQIHFPAAVDESMHLDDSWLAGADLVVVALEEMGTFTKRVHIPDFPLSGPRTEAENRSGR